MARHIDVYIWIMLTLQERGKTKFSNSLGKTEYCPTRNFVLSPCDRDSLKIISLIKEYFHHRNNNRETIFT